MIILPSYVIKSTLPTIAAVKYSSLPSSGSNNDIAILSGNNVTKTTVSYNAPSNPSEGNIWVKTGYASPDYVHLSYGNLTVRITSVLQYQSGSWVPVDYYIYKSNSWRHGRLEIVKNGVLTGTPLTLSKLGGNGSYYPDENPVRFYIKSSGNNAWDANLISGQYSLARYTRLYYRATMQATGGSGFGWIIYLESAYDSNNIIYGSTGSTRINNRTSTTDTDYFTFTNTNEKCRIRFDAHIQKLGNTATLKIYDLYLV